MALARHELGHYLGKIMNEIDLANTDLNLLVVLDVLLRERSVTATGKRLGRTQSAISHSLARLRDQLEDQLLVRHGNVMQLTPRAERIAPELTRLLKSIGRVLGQEQCFEPATTRRTFAMAVPDFVGTALPDLLTRINTTAPGARVELMSVDRSVFRDLGDGRIDIVVAPPCTRNDGRVRSSELAPLQWAVFAREGHPAIRKWGRRSWAKHPGIFVKTGSDSSNRVERAARESGIKRPKGPIIPSFSLAAPLLAGTDFLLTVPRAVLADAAPRYGLVALPCPIRLDPIVVAVQWSARLDRDPALVWFRDQVLSAMTDFAVAGNDPPIQRRRRAAR